MDAVQRRLAAKQFDETLKNRGDEKQDCENFCRSLPNKVYGVERPEDEILFEYLI